MTCKGPQQQKVKLATELTLSHTTATALRHYKPIQDTKLLSDTANFIELINNWYNLTNVAHTNDRSTPFKSPCGLFLEKQNLHFENIMKLLTNFSKRDSNVHQWDLLSSKYFEIKWTKLFTNI